MSIKEMKELKRKIRNQVENVDQWTIDAYYKGFEKFTNRIQQLNNTNLNLLDIRQVKLLNLINKINKYDLQFIMQEL